MVWTNHSHDPSASTKPSGDQKDEVRRYRLLFRIAIGILAVYLLGALEARSLALLTELGHLFADAVTIAIGLWGAIAAQDPLGTRIQKLVFRVNLGIMTIVIASTFVEALYRLQHPEEVDMAWMAPFAIVGIVASILLHRIHGHAPTEHRNGMHEFLEFEFISDAIINAAMLVGIVSIYFTGNKSIDPSLSLFIAACMAVKLAFLGKKHF